MIFYHDFILSSHSSN